MKLRELFPRLNRRRPVNPTPKSRSVRAYVRPQIESLEDRRVLSASLQVIHNSPYDAASSVDVYVNDALALDNFLFRDATGFLEVPSNTPLTIDIKGPESDASSPSVFSATVNLDDGVSYVAVAVGDPLNTAGQPSFDLALSGLGREMAEDPANAEFLVFHGSPDAPAVDVLARGVGPLAESLSFPEFAADYVSVPPASYTVDLTPSGDNTNVVASFEADLSGAAGSSLVVAASGFLSPPTETDPEFGLLAVFADGTTALLPSVDAPPARLQVIHNSPYEAASVVDVYANDALLLDNFAFRDASPFVDVPANVDVTLDITAADAADNSQPVFSTRVNLRSTTYVALAVGDPANTAGQPGFTLAVTDLGQEAAEDVANAEFLVFHGSPDAPTVDIIARGVGTLIDDLSYPEFADSYLSVPPASYIIDITPGEDNTNVVASFEADLSGAGGAAIVVAASGFLSPPSEGSPEFGLLAVFPDGTAALLPATDKPPVIGDSNGDGVFNEMDLMQVLQAGKYLTGEPATFAEGDWDGSGQFDQFDIIAALQAGNYSHSSNAGSTHAVDEVFRQEGEN